MRPRCANFKRVCWGKTLKAGHYVRKSDGRWVQRWRCNRCATYTSSAVRSPCYRQKKRQLNPMIRDLLCSLMSQRRIARFLGISRTTVARKFEFLAAQSLIQNHRLRTTLFAKGSINLAYVDEMEDRVHTKCKPVAIGLVVNESRKILAHSVSRIRPKNRKLNQISKKKYPNWTPNDRTGFDELIQKVCPFLSPKVEIRSDEKPFYFKIIRKHLPKSDHRRYPSRSATVAGQGELKEGGHDPLFALNQTCASLRANINRLIRKTWCTSKRLENLQKHIELYITYHNTVLT